MLFFYDCFFSKIFSFISLGVGMIFLSISLYRMTLPYDKEGRFFDGLNTYDEQAILSYGWFGIICIIVGMSINIFQKSRFIIPPSSASDRSHPPHG